MATLNREIRDASIAYHVGVHNGGAQDRFSLNVHSIAVAFDPMINDLHCHQGTLPPPYMSCPTKLLQPLSTV